MRAEPDKSNKPADSGCLSIIIFWSCVFGVLYVLESIDKESPGIGRELFGWIVGLCALGLLGYIVIDKTVADTTRNVLKIAKWVAIVLTVSFVLGGLSRCAGLNPDSYDENMIRAPRSL